MNRNRDLHSEPGDRPVQRDAEYRTVFDAAGQRHDLLLKGQVVSLSEDGSIDRAVVSVAHFYHCKHPATDPIGSQCGEPGCVNISCRACSANSSCLVCLRPLCLEHLEQIATPTGSLKFCARCKADFLRKKRWQSIVRMVLSPFVDFGDRKQS